MRLHLLLALVAAVAVVVLMVRSRLPVLPERAPSSALDAEVAAATMLGRALAPQLREHPGLSGIHALPDPLEAFAARMLLAHAAERTLDVQYYIWKSDRTGTMLLQALAAAADRGVRVRLLLDDGGTDGLDRELAALAQHPNVEVRLFNPFVLRRPKPLGYLADFSRLNRRMHNKSFIADNQVSIVGGRNIGDEYFGAADGVLFADLDVLAVGPVVAEASADFDRYWASESAWPARAILPPVGAGALSALAARAAALAGSEGAAVYTRAVQRTPFVSELLDQRLALRWSRVDMVSDDPAKGMGRASRGGLLASQLHRAVGTPQRSVGLVSPYFVPTRRGVEMLASLRASGVVVRVMTNAYEATDVPLVHAGYAMRRRPLLEAGVGLFEMHRMATLGGGQGRRPGQLGSSGSSLHAKIFTIDGERAFVGSFNFDPRSALLNTELGFVIHDPGLADRIERTFDTEIPRQSYTLRLSGTGAVQWLDTGSEPPTLHEVEPGSAWWSRAMLWLLALLPIEWLL